MKATMARVLCTVWGLLLLVACGTPTIRAYSGPALPPEQVAILTVEVHGILGVQPVLDALDGQTMHSGLRQVDMRVEMSPGPHRASIRFVNNTLGMMGCSADDQLVDFAAEPGHTYRVQATVTADFPPCALGGTKYWSASVVDVSAGN